MQNTRLHCMLRKYEVGIAVFEMTEITGRADIIHISDTLVFLLLFDFFWWSYCFS